MSDMISGGAKASKADHMDVCMPFAAARDGEKSGSLPKSGDNVTFDGTEPYGIENMITGSKKVM